MPPYTKDEKFMRRCLDLAVQGKGQTAPNPMVGSVLVQNNFIIGEGFHRAYGEPHAEVNAIGHVVNPELLKNASLYVNLEPCTHHGKTPPCADMILEKRIHRLVIGTSDPNPLVAGRGIKLLRENGVQVTPGILETECKDLNKRFFTWHLLKRPWVILKWAQSADRFIDLERPPGAPIGPNWITSETARTLVHKWRTEEQAILVGKNTVLKDNPRLNVRFWTGKDPLRIVIDRCLKLGRHHHIFDNSQETLIFTEKIPSDSGVVDNHQRRKKTTPQVITPGRVKTRYAAIDFDNTAELQMLDYLYKNNIQSLIIEGGAFTLTRFIEKGLWDEARIFTGPAMFKGGVKSPEITGKSKKCLKIGNSLLQIIYR